MRQPAEGVVGVRIMREGSVWREGQLLEVCGKEIVHHLTFAEQVREMLDDEVPKALGLEEVDGGGLAPNAEQNFVRG